MNGHLFSYDECFRNTTQTLTELGCNASWDGIMCWNQTPAGSVAKQPCPSIFGAMPDSFVLKTCEANGLWATPEFWKGFGYSDYTECVSHLSLIENVFEIEKVTERHEHYSDDYNLAIFGVPVLAVSSISAIFLVMSLICSYWLIPRTVNRSADYRISRYFTFALLAESFVTLIRMSFSVFGIYDKMNNSLSINPSAFCEAQLTASEYSCLVTCMWQFIRSHHLQLTTKSERLCLSGYLMYNLIGWGIPVVPTAIWAVTSYLSQKVTCWTDHQSQPIFWIVEVPKMLILGTSLAFVMLARLRLSQNFDILSKNCCYRRLHFETVSCTLSCTYLIMSIVLTIIFHQAMNTQETNLDFGIVCAVLHSGKGIMIPVIMWACNVDLRNVFRTKFTRISNQDVISSAVDDHEL